MRSRTVAAMHACVHSLWAVSERRSERPVRASPGWEPAPRSLPPARLHHRDSGKKDGLHVGALCANSGKRRRRQRGQLLQLDAVSTPRGSRSARPLLSISQIWSARPQCKRKKTGRTCEQRTCTPPAPLRAATTTDMLRHHSFSASGSITRLFPVPRSSFGHTCRGCSAIACRA